MKCPNCKADAAEGALECANCSIIFAKWQAKQVQATTQAVGSAPLPSSGGFPAGKLILLVGAVIGIILGLNAFRGKSGGKKFKYEPSQEELQAIGDKVMEDALENANKETQANMMETALKARGIHGDTLKHARQAAAAYESGSAQRLAELQNQ